MLSPKLRLYLLSFLSAIVPIFPNSSSYRLNWNSVRNASGYVLQISQNQDFARVVEERKLTENQTDVTLESGSYFFRVKALGDGIESIWSEPKPFSVGAVSETLQPITMADNSSYFRLGAGQKLVIDFNAQDSVSGVGDVFVRVNDGPFTRNAQGKMELRSDGSYQIEWYAADRAGNVGQKSRREIKIDSTAPEVTWALEGSSRTSDGAVRKEAKLVLRARDAFSGVKNVQWRREGTDQWNEYTAPIALGDVSDSGIIQFQSTDNAGNTSSLQRFIYTVRTQAPKMPIVFRSEQEPLRISAAGVRVPAIEPGSKFEYKIDEENYTQARSGDLLPFNQDGEHTIVFRLTDELGNVSEKSYKVVVDRQPPRTEMRSSEQ